MSKTANVFARVEPEVKEKAEQILSFLGISMSNAVGMFLRQVVLQSGMPFEVKLPPHPLDVSKMTKEEFDAELQKAWEQRGEGTPVEDVIDEFERSFENELQSNNNTNGESEPE